MEAAEEVALPAFSGPRFRWVLRVVLDHLPAHGVDLPPHRRTERHSTRAKCRAAKPLEMRRCWISDRALAGRVCADKGLYLFRSGLPCRRIWGEGDQLIAKPATFCTGKPAGRSSGQRHSPPLGSENRTARGARTVDGASATMASLRRAKTVRITGMRPAGKTAARESPGPTAVAFSK